MTTPNSIEIQALCKRYRLGTGHRTGQLREQLMHLFRPRADESREEDILWALRDISFTVPEGEVVGIIGRNGAGKSTLLKILSRITQPTTGSIQVRGRVASLLEVGTGFHEELTGRENIYLNGSILGMRRREIERHFDAIVEFSGLSQFVDTPIKRFSSGMRLRLGFAVAAHLDPDVLIVDEVLAVGDAGFQKKCISAMEDLRSGGRTVLFVSHNMAAVENLCSRGIWIDKGQLRLDGTSKEVIRAYLGSYSGEEAGAQELQIEGRGGSGEVRFTRVELRALDGAPAPIIQSGDGLVIRMHFRAERRVERPAFTVRLYSSMGTLIADTSTGLHNVAIPATGPGDGYVDLELERLNLVSGRYTLMFKVEGGVEGRVWDEDVRCYLDVEPSADTGTVRPLNSRHGLVYFSQRWKINGAAAQVEFDDARRVDAALG
ncbi:MAG: ABC transporter ATP-binding protein [Steroidobacteraceae bacterium]|nr:ABC transporter ATP-binding protein [Steroidobacteraceae bacterium]